MYEKITLGYFREILEKCHDLFLKISALEAEYPIQEDNKQLLFEYATQYRSLQDVLLSFDLSDIPFEEWKDYHILPYDGEVVDFQKTHANIDFAIVSYFDGAYFHGCNIRNIDKVIGEFHPEQFDEKTKMENSFYFFPSDFPENFLHDFYSMNLSLEDIMSLTPEQFEIFKTKKWSHNIDYNSVRTIQFLGGIDSFYQLSQKHFEAFQFIFSHNHKDRFSRYLFGGNSPESTLKNAVKMYYVHEVARFDNPDIETIEMPNWMESFQFHVIPSFHSIDEIMEYDEDTFVLDYNQNLFINSLGIDNLKRLEKEIGFFSYYSKDDLYFFIESVNLFRNTFLMDYNISFQKGCLDYDSFLNQFTGFINIMAEKNFFTDYPDYSWIQGTFRDRFPNLFIDDNAPDKLKRLFYKRRIDIQALFSNPGYVPYIAQKDLESILDVKTTILVKDTNQAEMSFDFVHECTTRYGNSFTLQLITKYGTLLHNLTIHCSESDLDSEESFETALQKAIYGKIVNSKVNYIHLLKVPSFVKSYPELFLSLRSIQDISDDEKRALLTDYYARNWSYDVIRKYPQLIPLLENKNLIVPFGQVFFSQSVGKFSFDIQTASNTDYILQRCFGNHVFLELCSIYGRYMENMAPVLSRICEVKDNQLYYRSGNFEALTFEDIKIELKRIIEEECLIGNVAYLPDDAPTFLRVGHPELFLSEDAPTLLKNYFYRTSPNFSMSLSIIKDHIEEWMPYLKGKRVSAALLKNPYLKQEMAQYFYYFGEEKGLQFGVKRYETVQEMIRNQKVHVMWEWYLKTGKKFIPDFVVMENFPIEDADKFLTSASVWSKLMRIKEFADTAEHRDAMLKLAYSFGAFDVDQRGIKSVFEVLTGLPRKLTEENAHSLTTIDEIISNNSRNLDYFSGDNEKAYQHMVDYLRQNQFHDSFHTEHLLALFEAFQKENFPIDYSQHIFQQIYLKNEDGTFSLSFNPQSYPMTTAAIRAILCKFQDIPIISPDNAHHFIGGFKMEYDPNFREFFLKYYDEIISNRGILSRLAIIQRRFKEIKTLYSNVPLTLNLVLSYIEQNKYTQVQTGNERVSTVAAMNEYNQEDFETLQRIYNYARKRTFSSIPKIEGQKGKYRYKFLRLDDPLAMAIGKLSDCCQRLGEPAEVCMEHSMVDPNGRVFVVYDENGELVAQSWVWRNKNVLCFDNIEVPDAQMHKHGIPKGLEDDGIQNEFTDEILSIYQQAAEEIVLKDEKMFYDLFLKGKISKEEYERLRITKVTAGLGYTNISGSLKTLPMDHGRIARPISFKEPVPLKRGLYTSDSQTQYILKDEKIEPSADDSTLPLYYDDYILYDDTNFDEDALYSLQRIEKANREDEDSNTQIYNYQKGSIVSSLANNYDLDRNTTRIILHPNFAIIYDIVGNRIRIGDLLFQESVQDELTQMIIEQPTAIQIKLALDQISKGREFDVSRLDKRQLDMFHLAMQMSNQIDIERGLTHAN